MTIGPITHLSGSRGSGPALEQDKRDDRLHLGGPSAGPLLEQVRSSVSGTLATMGRAADPVASARLEGAALTFAREVRALAIGSPDVSQADREAAIAGALANGDRAVTALPSVGFDPVDRLVHSFEAAAGVLAAHQAAPLVPLNPSNGA